MNLSDIEIRIIRSARRTLALEVRRDGSVVVRAPYLMSRSKIDSFVESKRTWIAKHVAKMLERMEQDRMREGWLNNGAASGDGALSGDDAAPGRKPNELSNKELEMLREEARRDLTARTAHWSAVMGITYNRIAIRFQKIRWGSCSSKGNINLNAALMLCPEQVRDYVVIHELAHRREMNHSQRFWAIVEKYCPSYGTCRKFLRDNGARIIKQ